MLAGWLNKGFRGSLPLLILMLVAGWLLHVFASGAVEAEFYPDLFYNYFTRHIHSQVWEVTLNFFLAAVAMVLLGMIVTNQEIVDKLNHFPLFIYMLLCLACLSPAQVSSQAVTNLFVLYSVYRLLDIYRNQRVLNHIFEAAFWLCCSAFITISSIINFPVFFITLLILRPFHWREWIVALMGFFMPVFIYECIAYLTEFNRWYLFEAGAQYFRYLRLPTLSEYYFPLALVLVLLLLAAFVQNLTRGSGNTVKKQRSRNVFFWLMLFSMISFFSAGATSSGILLSFAIPLSIFIGDFLFRIRRQKVTNTLLILLIACVAIVISGMYEIV